MLKKNTCMKILRGSLMNMPFRVRCLKMQHKNEHQYDDTVKPQEETVQYDVMAMTQPHSHPKEDIDCNPCPAYLPTSSAVSGR